MGSGDSGVGVVEVSEDLTDEVPSPFDHSNYSTTVRRDRRGGTYIG